VKTLFIIYNIRACVPVLQESYNSLIMRVLDTFQPGKVLMTIFANKVTQLFGIVLHFCEYWNITKVLQKSYPLMFATAVIINYLVNWSFGLFPSFVLLYCFLILCHKSSILWRYRLLLQFMLIINDCPLPISIVESIAILERLISAHL